MFARHIGPQGDARRKLVVSVRTLDQVLIAVVGKPRLRIGGHVEHDRLVTALDQHVGDRFVERAASRDGEQMVLAFGARGHDQGVNIEQLGMLEHRRGNRDLVVTCQSTADHRRCARILCQAIGQGGARRYFDHDGDTHESVVEKLDLAGGIAGRSAHEDIGDTPNDFGAPFGHTFGDGVTEFVEQIGEAHADGSYPKKMGGLLRRKKTAGRILKRLINDKSKSAAVAWQRIKCA